MLVVGVTVLDDTEGVFVMGVEVVEEVEGLVDGVVEAVVEGLVEIVVDRVVVVVEEEVGVLGVVELGEVDDEGDEELELAELDALVEELSEDADELDIVEEEVGALLVEGIVLLVGTIEVLDEMEVVTGVVVDAGVVVVGMGDELGLSEALLLIGGLVVDTAGDVVDTIGVEVDTMGEEVVNSGEVVDGIPPVLLLGSSDPVVGPLGIPVVSVGLVKAGVVLGLIEGEGVIIEVVVEGPEGVIRTEPEVVTETIVGVTLIEVEVIFRNCGGVGFLEVEEPDGAGAVGVGLFEDDRVGVGGLVVVEPPGVCPCRAGVGLF